MISALKSKTILGNARKLVRVHITVERCKVQIAMRVYFCVKPSRIRSVKYAGRAMKRFERQAKLYGSHSYTKHVRNVAIDDVFV